jgi:hypothetical protein
MMQETYGGLVEGLVAECVVDLICPGALYPCKDFLVWYVLYLGDVVVAGVVLEDYSLDQVLATS